MWQRYGFSPVCDRRCTIRLLWNRKDLPQYSHDLSFGDAAREDGVPHSDDGLARLGGADVAVGVNGAPVVEVADAENAGGVSCLRGDDGALLAAGVPEGLVAPASCRSRCE